MITTIQKPCEECAKQITVLATEVKRGGGKFCSRACYYSNLKKTRPSGKESWAWKGSKVGKQALHDWVIRTLGRPQKCEDCGTTKAKKFEWANISQKYKREVFDWKRLCSKCHAKFDRPTRYKKWRKAVEARGWKVKIKK